MLEPKMNEKMPLTQCATERITALNKSLLHVFALCVQECTTGGSCHIALAILSDSFTEVNEYQNKQRMSHANEARLHESELRKDKSQNQKPKGE